MEAARNLFPPLGFGLMATANEPYDNLCDG
jgi:hypothetical protein